MASKHGQAWITFAGDDDTVVHALVLAESLRRARTTRRLGVIVSKNVSNESKHVLWKAFDALFLLDEDFLSNGNLGMEDRAKVYAFSLKIFDKCVFLSPRTLILENPDKLFEGRKAFKVLKNGRDGSFDMSVFLFRPNMSLCDYVAENVNKNGEIMSEKYLRKWLEHEYGSKLVYYLSGNSILKLSLSKGRLLRTRTRASIIQFVDCGSTFEAFHKNVMSLKEAELGLFEKLIAEYWLKLFDEKVAGIMKTPNLAPCVSAADFGDVYVNEPIAIVGMSCRFPGVSNSSNNLQEFWNLLHKGEEAIGEPPAFRWTKEHSLRVTQNERKTNAGFLSTKIDEFDAKFFGVNPKEAQFMDPQCRILHEVLWEALEDGGINPHSLKGTNGGIFVGSWMNDYKDIVQGSTEEKDFFRTYMGNSIGATAARLSFFLGLTGPSVATESGCSSGIVSLDLGVKSLRAGECNLAMVGGVNLLLHPFTSKIMDYVIAPDGRCKTFDARANGFARAEGCGILVLKRLTEALRDGDHIWAMIRGSAVSQEGISKSLGTPTVHCEALAMELALKDAGVGPGQISFVETHGTGTSVGDPMEVRSIQKAYQTPERKSPLIIGSVKTNVGHTESCSGITGIIKTVLAMHHELIPKHKCLDSGFNLNPEIDLDSIPAIIPMEPVSWPKVNGEPRMAGISSFGITGTDGHVILEEAPDFDMPRVKLGLERPLHIMKISGKSPEALEELLQSYKEHFQAGRGDFSNAAYTANTGRASFNHRAFILASDYEGAVKALETNQCLRGDTSNIPSGKICFLFTGQGSQYPGMAKMLYESSSVFRVNFDMCEKTLQEKYDISLLPVVFNLEGSEELSRTLYSQTAIFVVEYCLWMLWKSWGVKPDYVVGHSLGEFAAAVAAGALGFEDALILVAERSRLIDGLPRGKMLVIKADEMTVNKAVSEFRKCRPDFSLDIAALNSPEQTVIAGDSDMILDFSKFCDEKSLKSAILAATHAFHSKHMDKILPDYHQLASTISKSILKKNTPKFISGMEGRVIEVDSIDANYWVRHTREKVSFIDACKTLRQLECSNYLEIGPQPVLSSFIMTNIEDLQVSCVPSLRKGTNDWETILTSLGKLYLFGYDINWKGFDEPYRRKRVSLPFHPFHRKSFWVESNGTSATMIHPLIGHSLSNASNLHIFQNELHLKSVPYLKDHCIGNRIVFPGAAYTEMCLSAGYCVANGLTDSMERPKKAITLENVRIDAPLELTEGKRCRFQVLVNLPDSLTPEAEESKGFQIKVFHQNTMDTESSTGKWVLHATSNFSPVPNTNAALKYWNPESIQEVIDKGDELTSIEFYQAVDDTGLKFGDKFRSIQRHWNLKDGNENVDRVVAEVCIPEDSGKYLLHPVLLDAAIQSGIVTLMRYETSKLKVPVRLGKLTLFPTVELNEKAEAEQNGSIVWIYAWRQNGKFFHFITSPKLNPIALIEDIELVDTNVKTIESVLEQQTSKYPDSWEEVWKPINGPFTNQVELLSLPQILAAEEFQSELKASGRTSTEDVETQEKISRLLYLYILNAFYELGWSPKPDEIIEAQSFCKDFGIIPQFQQLVRFYFSTLQNEDRILLSDSKRKFWKVINLPPPQALVKAEMTNLFNYLSQGGARKVIDIYHRLAFSLTCILKGEESALSILFPTEESQQQYSADSYYQNYPGRPHVLAKMQAILFNIFKKLREANSSTPERTYRILEVGSGTGSLSKHAIEWLHELWGDKFEYYYTDISQSFFGKAEKKLENYINQLKFCVFNIEQSPLEQGIPINYFDCVLATDVLHATRSLRESLVHIRQTMRAGGVLCFTETLVEALDLTFVFGLVEGYWRFQDFDVRPYHSCCGGNVWREVMQNSGFRSVDVTSAFLDAFGCITAEVSGDVDMFELVANPEQVQSESVQKWVVFADGGSQAIRKVCKFLCSTGYQVEVVLRSSDKMQCEFRIDGVSYNKVLAESEDPSDIELLLRGNTQGIIYAWGMDLKETDQRRVALPFLHISKHLVNAKKPPRLYILTRGVHAITDSTIANPTAATLFGMVKSLKNENFELFVRYIDLDLNDRGNELDQIMFELAMSKSHRESSRVQVVYRDCQRYEPRFVKAQMPSAQDELTLPQSTDRYHLVLPKTRLINDLEFDAMGEQALSEGEIEVKVKAYALNFKDILTILKPSAEFETLNTVGLDYAGVVSKVGKGVTEDMIKVGDGVFGCNFKEAQLPSHLVVTPGSVVKIPERMSYWEAATLPAVFATSYYCLMNVAKMKKGETVLIHTGSGGVGLSAIQLAKHVGAKIITTAGSPRKRAYLKSLGIEHVFNSRNDSFHGEIMKVTNGFGVDIVLNSITGPGLKEASLQSCAENARFVEMSKLAIWTEAEVFALRPDVNYSIVDLTYLDHSAWKELLQQMKQFLEQGKVKAIPFVKFDALNIRQALQYFQKAKHIGKVVCAMPEIRKKDGQFKTHVPLFNKESSYLITGGLGGIGFEVGKWMLDRGAKHIVLTGRNPPKKEIAEKIDELNANGHNVIVKYADVGNYEQIEIVIKWIQDNLMPLRGIMHCAGVLHDNLYVNQTWDSFDATFTPKVRGTWNLHHLTANLALEHFVFYSSITALVGTPGQPNHSSANCFEDAFAHYRHSLGLPATSINWGQWAQVGCAKEITMSGVLPISVTRMLNGLESTLRSQKVRGCFMDFESYSTWSMLCPMFKSYLDERLWKQFSKNVESSANLNTDQFWGEMDRLESKDEKVPVIGSYLKGILRQALRLDPDEAINDDADIQDIGVDSLMLIELKNSIQTLLGSRVNVTASLLKNCHTVRELSTAIVGAIVGDDESTEQNHLSPEELRELLLNDCQLPEHITAQNPCVVKPSEIKNILITGPTGQLGPYIISELCEEHKYLDKIICLIRAKEGVDPAERLQKILSSMNLMHKVNMEKILCVSGDVAHPNFGLSEDTYQDLCQSVDAIIHCAVKANHVEMYRAVEGKNLTDIRNVNVGGTLNVLKFAAERKTKLVYYASAYTCIFGGNEEGTLSDDWPTLDQIQTIVDNNIPGYQTSKFVCEHLLSQANARGIPCTCFRFPWITGDSQTGQLNYVQNHYILRFLSYLKLKMIPSLVAPAIVLPVDICARISLKLFMNDNAPFEIFNVGHPQPQVEQEFVTVAKQDFGIEMEIVEIEEFADRLSQDKNPLESFKELYADVERIKGLFTSDAVQSLKGYLNAPETFFKNEKVARFVPDFAQGIPSSMDIIRKDLKYVRSKGFFEKFGI